jgi:DNA repair exonuclease SbcCD ATPase subunit
MGRDDLMEKLSTLEELRKMAEGELEALRSRQERLEGLERDKDVLLESYAQMAPKALDSLTPEERHHVYSILGVKALIKMDGALEISGTFGEWDALCGTEVRSSRP